MNDKDLLYVIIEREIDNLLRHNPAFAIFSNTIKNKLITFIDPYVEMFMEGDRIETEVVSAFTKQEINSKIEEFKQKFNKEKIEYETE